MFPLFHDGFVFLLSIFVFNKKSAPILKCSIILSRQDIVKFPRTTCDNTRKKWKIPHFWQLKNQKMYSTLTFFFVIKTWNFLLITNYINRHNIVSDNRNYKYIIIIRVNLEYSLKNIRPFVAANYGRLDSWTTPVFIVQNGHNL